MMILSIVLMFTHVSEFHFRFETLNETEDRKIYEPGCAAHFFNDIFLFE